MPLLIVAGIIIAIFIVGNWLRELQKKRRTTAMQALAERLALSFEPEGAPDELVSMGDLLLFSQGWPSSTLKNMMRGTRDGADVAVYDYVFNIPVSRYVENWRQTVVHIRSEEPTLPQFSLCPQAVLDAVLINMPSREKREALLGTVGVRFPAHPEFTERYKLMAVNRDELGRLFDDTVLAYLDGVKDVCVEVSGKYLFYYRMHKPLPLEEIEPLLDEAVALFRILCEKQEIKDEMA
jgi:hypothetical protein